MIHKLIHAWRWFFSFLAYFLYGLFSLLGALIFFIPFLLLPKKVSKKLAQFLVHFSYCLLTKFLILTGVMAVRINNKNDLKNLKGSLIIANHPSFLDIVVLLSILPKADCIVKSSLWNNVFIGCMVRASQYIISDNPHQLVETCMARLKEGNNVVIFPEGTRSNPESLKEFKRGFATIAINSACPLVPIFLRCTPPALTKQCNWYSIPAKRFVFSINVFPPIDTLKINRKASDVFLTSKELALQTEQFFESLMNSNGDNHQSLFQKHFVENL